MKRSFVGAVIVMVATAVAAQVTETEPRGPHGTHAGKTVHAGSLTLTIRSDGGSHFGAGDMPMLTSVKDQNGRDLEIRADNGNLIASIAYDGDGHPAKITFPDDLKLTVTREGKRLYKETLIGHTGKAITVRDVDATYSRPCGGVVLDAVASSLGLSANWRNEVTIEAADSTHIVKAKTTGKTLLYVVRDGPNQVGFDPDGKPVFYEVWANLYSGFASHAEDFGDLQTVVPDRFVYTRDGRVGAYVYTPSRTAISSVWIEKDAAGTSTINYQSDVQSAGPKSGSSSGTAKAPDSTPAIQNVRRYLRPRADATTCTYIYEYTYQTCEYYPDGTLIGCSDPTDVYDKYCYYTPDPYGGGVTGGGGSTSANQTTGTLNNTVGNAINKANTKLQTSQCSSLFANLTTNSPQFGGTVLYTIMQQRGSPTPQYYLNNGVGFYNGQSQQNANGQIPCQQNSALLAWTNPGSPQVWICDYFNSLQLNPGFGGDILIHELLHTLGLPEGGTGQYTYDQITNLVVQACGQ